MHIQSIGAGIYSDLSISTAPVDQAAVDALILDPSNGTTGFPSRFGTGEFERVQNIREFPSMGTPPNIVNVPVYGQASSQQIQGQSDAPSMEITLNFVPSDWADGETLGDMVGNGLQYVFRFTMMNAEPSDFVEGAFGCQNSMYYWVGKIEALQVNPQLTDANTAVISITIQSDFYGAYTSV